MQLDVAWQLTKSSLSLDVAVWPRPFCILCHWTQFHLLFLLLTIYNALLVLSPLMSLMGCHLNHLKSRQPSEMINSELEIEILEKLRMKMGVMNYLHFGLARVTWEVWFYCRVRLTDFFLKVMNVMNLNRMILHL